MPAKGSSYATAARHEAQQILAHAPFHVGPARAPAPLAGLLHAIGRGLDDAFGKPTAWVWEHTVVSLHGAIGNWAWLLLAGAGLAVGGGVGVLLLGRRGVVGDEAEVAMSAAAVPDAQALERAADDAEERGAYDLAVRLRFQAGLCRLETRGIIASRLTATTDGLRARLGSPAFDRLAARHEAIAYAHDPASKEDFESARTGWRLVLEETEALTASASDKRR